MKMSFGKGLWVAVCFLAACATWVLDNISLRMSQSASQVSPEALQRFAQKFMEMAAARGQKPSPDTKRYDASEDDERKSGDPSEKMQEEKEEQKEQEERNEGAAAEDEEYQQDEDAEAGEEEDEVVDDPLVDVPEQAQKHAPKHAPKQAPKQAPKHAPKQAPKQAPEQASGPQDDIAVMDKCNSSTHRKEWMMCGRRMASLPRAKFPEAHKLWDGGSDAICQQSCAVLYCLQSFHFHVPIPAAA